MPRVDERLLGFAKAQRKEITPPEARLWDRLRAKRLNGIKFVRQSVRRPYIADFVARTHKLIIELDGETHAHAEEYAARRTDQLEDEGYRIIRFTNADVMGNVEGVLTNILTALEHSPSPRPSPRRGEGEEAALHDSLSPPGRGPGRGDGPAPPSKATSPQ